MAKKDSTEQQTSLVPANGGNGNNGGGAALALASRDELADVLGDAHLETDGLEEIGAEDIKIGLKVFNFKGTTPAGDPIPPNVFFDTVEETTKKELDLALLTITKGNEWRSFDQASQQTVVHCRSFDRETGTMADGTERYCQGCPDAQWRTDSTGKRGRNCGPVYSVVAVERDVGTPCIVRFRRTSLPVIQQYLNRHIIGRRIVAGKPSNYPLFAFQTKATLKMEKNGASSYAVPVLERGPVLSRGEIEQHAESARVYRETVLPLLRKIVEKDAGGAGEPDGDASFNADEFADPAKNGGGASAADGLR